MKIAAIVPMRHESERVPGKNYRLFAGKPLFHHVIESLLDCPAIGEVVIDTDSQTIRDEAESQFPTVTVLERPGHLRDGSISMNEVLLNTTACVSADYYLQTHSTNPLLTAATISRATRVFLDNRVNHDSLFSVKCLRTRLWSAAGVPVNHDPARLIRTQDLSPIFEENSCIYIFTRRILERNGNRIGETPLLFEMDPVESWDIDEEVEFQIAELIFLNRDSLGRSKT